MKNYISTIIYICIFSIILELILPESKLRKYIATVIGLLIIITLVTPVFNFLKNDNVVEVISSTLNKVASNNVDKKNKYDFSNLQNKMILNRTKENIEEDILKSCTQKFDGKVKKVSIKLNDKYNIESIKVYVSDMEEIYLASQIMEYITDEYNVQNEYIEVIKN